MLSDIKAEIGDGLRSEFSATLSNEINASEKSLKNFLETWNGTGDIFQQYKDYMKESADITSIFGNKLESFAATAISAAANMAIMFAVSKVVSVLYDLSQVSDEVAQKAANLSGEFRNDESDISSYKNKIAELYSTINDSGSSLEAVTAARQNLMAIQDELISRFGTEKDAISIVTDAINGQSDALDQLTQKQWQDTLNNFNNGSWTNDVANFFDGYSNNIDRMMDQFGNYTAHIDIGTAVSNWKSDEANSIIDELTKAGANLSFTDAGVPLLDLNGTASEVYDKLLDIQEVFSDKNPLTTKYFGEELTNLANAAKEVSSQYEGMFNQYILYEKIFKNDSYTKSFHNINDAYKEYQNAFVSGDNESINEATEKLSTVMASATDGVTDENVIRYFEEMYPSVKAVVDRWEFNAKILPTFDTNGIKGKTQNDILTMLQTDGLQEGEEAFNAILQSAKDSDIISDIDSKGIQQLLDLLSEWGILQKKIATDTNTPDEIQIFSKSDAISKVNELSEGLEFLEKIMSSISDDGTSFDYTLLDDVSFKENFQQLGDDYTNFIETISNSPKDINACQNAFDSLVTAYLNQKGITTALNEDTKYLIISMLENMGVTNAETIAVEYLNQQQERLTAQKYYTAQASDALSNATADEINAILAEADASGISSQYIAQLELAKIAVDGAKIDTTDDIEQIINLANAAGASAEVLEALSEVKTVLSSDISDSFSDNYDPGRVQAALKTMEQLKDGTFDYKVSLDAKKFKHANFNGSKKSKPNNEKTPKEEKAPKKETFDFVQRRKDSLEKEHAEVEELTNNENIAYETQLNLLSELITMDKERKAFAEGAAQNYENTWLEAQENIRKAVSDTDYSSDEIIGYIKEGSDRMYEYVGDDVVDSINAGIDAYDKLNSNAEYSANLENEINEHLEKQRQMRLDISNAQTDELTSKANKLQSEIDLLEAKGGIANESMLHRQINISKDIEASYQNQLHSLEDIRNNAEPLSAEYYNTKSKIADCEEAIIQCQIEQAEWNEEILNLPIRRIERYLELLGNIKQDLTNFIDIQSASGTATTLEQYQELIGLTNEQLDSLIRKHEELQNKLSHYQYGSDKFNEIQSDIQDIEDEIASLIQSTKEWIQEILNIPIDNIQKVNDTLSSLAQTMGDILSEYDTAVSAVTNTVDKQIEAINELSEATNQEYESKLSPLQDELDLLQKQNEARKTQLALEQAQYDLERAKNQKTNQVVRNGELVYEADQDALRDANTSIMDAEYNSTIDRLENQIASLEKQRDEILDGYDQQIDKLDEIKERWSNISSDIQMAIDSLKADELLGNGWQDKIISGNDDDIYKTMKEWYSSLSIQKNQYEQQIESNERIAALMEQFASLYQNGSITYEQAMAGIQNLTAQMGNGFTSLENLNALLQLDGAGSLSSLIDKAQSSAMQSVNQMSEYLKVVKDNSDALSDYIMTWDEMKQNIKDQVEALKAAAEALKNRPSSKPSHSNRDDNENDSYTGPTDTYVGGQYVHTNDGHGNYYDKNTGEQVNDPAKNLENALDKYKKHDGIESGLIGRSDMTREKMLKILATDGLKPNETIAKVLKGEAILTQEQQEQLLKNFSIASYSAPPMIAIPEMMAANDSQANIEVSMGNIVLQGVQDPDGLARAIERDLPGIIRQKIHMR